MTAGESITMKVAEALEACGISFLLSGSFASNFYGIPRSTRDADFVLQTQRAVGPEFVKHLGDDFLLDPQLTFETNTGTFRQVLRHKKSAFKVELFLLTQDPHDQSRFQRRRAVELHGRRLWLPSPEDVVVTKLRWARGKDKDDVRDVMAVQRDRLEWDYIEQWCRRHGTLGLMEEIRHSLPAR
jgi:predicted nucleotidyltransferase